MNIWKVPETGTRPKIFPAAHRGRCQTCGDWIDEGDPIGYLPGDEHVSCEACVAEHNEEQA